LRWRFWKPLTLPKQPSRKRQRFSGLTDAVAKPQNPSRVNLGTLANSTIAPQIHRRADFPKLCCGGSYVAQRLEGQLRGGLTIHGHNIIAPAFSPFGHARIAPDPARGNRTRLPARD